MSFSPELAEIRFGCGLSPAIAAPASAQELFNRLVAPDHMAQRFPIERFEEFRERHKRFSNLNGQLRKAKSDADKPALQEGMKQERRAARVAATQWFGQTVLRWSQTDQGLRERLVVFWADHFTAVGKAGILKLANATYVEEAIRPNIAGRFADMLIATVTHPLMLHYLDQGVSVGPESPAAKNNKRLGGLNENLAREVLELHTLGVGGPYSQQDVRQLAELFTGMSQNPKQGFHFRKRWVEPGRETVLGKAYGGGKPALEPILEALEDLAMHPTTARHLCWKLAVHLVSDTPDQGLIDHMTARYLTTGGALLDVYAAMLEHPASWEEPLRNVKTPFAFVASACRALQVSSDSFQELKVRRLNGMFLGPLSVMGQAWLSPGGPNGWPEEDEAWITPQGLAARMRWAMAAPPRLRRDLPDPRAFHEEVLGRFSTPELRFAAASAETRAEAVGLVLMSPSFQRR